MTSATRTTQDLHLRAGATANGVWDTWITPDVAGWGWTSLRAADLAPGQEISLDTGDDEVVLVPLRGSLTVVIDGSEGEDHRYELAGRPSVFAGPTDVLYLPAGSQAVLSTSPDDDGGRVGVPGAKTGVLPDGVRKPVRYIATDEVAVELRGAGSCTREVRNFASADVDVASKLVAVEVITPAGNWSSYPPHKHDVTSEHESKLEEIYYYEVAPGPGGQPGVGYHRTYSTPEVEDRQDRAIDVLVEVRDRDTVLVPHGWHGPCMAAPGHHLYYLNAMAGPADDRAWRIVDDPDHAWVRSTWAGRPTDPRLPLGGPQ
ncbi:5-deoxyglucuronate isomerase [Quadrisphaera granulorum]|uniref:5-deoxyglucuronate isomerase n=1 Tax=Quadrisphaera granulorum TaxID=317664 RepID=A0A315ZRJ2_9ACTN|nr:5-deoxy-glucuronate isomerase [Quadrisphaera granulorum]PWJ47743.1 5-deoxyglucuronate isomerase [Quadrisphaera granulorum]SZE98697.1 5-deoxyglucuronate isomerase [Quadrisphaera granulorum]